MTVLSRAVAIAVVVVGVLFDGHGGAAPLNLGDLGVAGTVTPPGVAFIHCLGTTAMHSHGTLHYSVPTVPDSRTGVLRPLRAA
ncbi:hypothetical protein [Streptomyces bobili]|uniref:hypothetical protein n=1 Tax=Streptomyces bobili TaxID=67280 RepID=UPI00371790F3